MYCLLSTTTAELSSYNNGNMYHKVCTSTNKKFADPDQKHGASPEKKFLKSRFSYSDRELRVMVFLFQKYQQDGMDNFFDIFHFNILGILKIFKFLEVILKCLSFKLRGTFQVWKS